MSENVELFTTRVKKATRKIQSMSHALVNAKFALSLRDKAVWGGGLFVFYHIIAFLEDVRERLDMPDYNKFFVHNTLYRKKAFEADLAHYIGEGWRSMRRSSALDSYLEHLRELERESPRLLIAYVYHLYLNLLSAGQLLALAYMRKMFEDKSKDYTDQVTDFTDIDICQLKNDFRSAMNEIAAKMSPEEQQAFLDESNKVFLMNNLVVNSVVGQNQALYTMLYKVSAILFLIIFGAVLAYKMHTSELRNRIYRHYFLD